MSVRAGNFTIRETHGVLQRPGVQVLLSSDSRAWSSLYASVQRESPFEGTFAAVADLAMVLHLDGPVMVHCRTPRGENSRLNQAGAIVTIPGEMDFRIRLGGSARSLHLYLRRALINEVAADIIDRDPTHVEILPRFGEHDRLMEALMRGLIDALREEDQSAKPYVDHLTRALAARLIRQHSTATFGANRAAAAAPIAKANLNKAIDFVEANLDQSIGLPAIAEAAGLSVSHFARQFRAAVGEAPHQYLLRRRIENAKQRLAKTDASIAEIAFTCGFANQEHLTRILKRTCGFSPAAYRKAFRG
jgi:AraC family transcriptional regulator